MTALSSAHDGVVYDALLAHPDRYAVEFVKAGANTHNLPPVRYFIINVI
jgi:hypothetical protein